MKSEVSYLRDELEKHSEFSNFEIYVNKSTRWISDKENTQQNSEKKSALLSQKGKNNSTRNPDKLEIIWLKNNSIAIILTLTKNIKPPTLEKWKNDANRAWQNAELRFKANHDSLTGLLNRGGAEENLNRYWPKIDISTPAENDEEQTSANISVSIFSLDIDHFKQINDTYGHGIGDKVLKNFAKCLEMAVSKLEAKHIGEYILSRPGGEEFEIIYIGSAESIEIKSIADFLITEIRQKNTKLAEADDLIQNYPDKVLASIGVSKLTNRSKGLIEKLRTQADQALYRAKKDGRDRFRFFSDISQKHGRVLEYHPSSEVAIIDIGKSSTVNNGDLYKVYYPPFTGDEDCILDDGRSKKNIGKYIPIDSAEIQVIDTQAEISTCLVTKKYTEHPIPAGSLLRKIPSGTKAVSHPFRKHPSSLGNSEQLKESLIRSIGNNSFTALINIAPTPVSADIEKLATQLNRLATLIYINFPENIEVFSGNGATLNILIRDEKISSLSENEKINESKRIIQENLSSLKNAIDFRAGVYAFHLEKKIKSPNDQIALHLARAALRSNHLSDNKEKLFSYFSSHETLLMWRRQGNLEEGLFDYFSFKSYGLNSPGIENQMGLILIESNDKENYQMAINSFNNAIKKAPNNAQYHANLAFALAKIGKYLEAFSKFTEYSSFIKTQKVSVYMVSYAKCIMEIWNEIGDDLKPDLLQTMLATISMPNEKTLPIQQIQWLEAAKDWMAKKPI
jgi:diguanylate cyclase (GGDEF)-like protein